MGKIMYFVRAKGVSKENHHQENFWFIIAADDTTTPEELTELLLDNAEAKHLFTDILSVTRI